MHHTPAPIANSPSPSRRRQTAKTAARLLPWIVCVTLLAGGGLWFVRHSKSSAASPASAKPAKAKEVAPISVVGVKVAPVPFQEVIVANGTLRADEAVELQTEVNGKVASINFAEGQQVSAGDVLVKIDDTSLQASLRRAEARRDLARVRETRLARLVVEGGVSKLEYDESRGELAVLETEIDIIRAEIKKTSIRAPFDGVVGLRFVSVGAYVSPATRIATLQNLGKLKVDFSIPERYAPFVKPGAPVKFTAAGSAKIFLGEVTAIEPRIDVSTRTILLRAFCTNPDLSLIPGLFARIEFSVNQSEQAILIPAIVLVSGLDERYVFVARDGKATRVKVKIGARTDTQVQILEGLKPGDMLITSGVQQLRSGLPVKLTEAKK